MKKNCFNKSVLLKKILLLLLSIAGGWVMPKAQQVEIGNGVNIQASYYNRGNVNIGWDLMAEFPEIEALRIEIEPYRNRQAIQWIREAHKGGYQVIATYHNSNQLGSDKKEDLLAAARWWRDNYSAFITRGPIIINIMNEWGSHDLSPEEFAAAYNEAIPIIREVYDGPLIVDAPGFGQATRIAADAYPFFQDTQIIFSVHIYSNAYNQEENRWLNEEDLTYLAAAGATCMIGEFCDNKLGGADWCSLIDYCYNNDWPLFGWAWNGDGGMMNMIEPHWRDQPLAANFRPTAKMKTIINKLAGVPCFSISDAACDASLIGDSCNDGNPYTINDRYNENCHCTGIFTPFLNSVLAESSLLIYPNPVGRNAQLSVELIKLPDSGVLRIYNSNGQEIEAIPVSRNTDRIQVDVGHLSNGIYWAAFHGQQRTNITSKFIK